MLKFRPFGSHASGAGYEKERLQALSDGVFSIVMTLLVLNLITNQVLGARSAVELHGILIDLLPKVISYIISFAVAARFWVAHHGMMSDIARVDPRFLWLNALFLFWISLLPFSAALLGEHHQYAISEIIYGGNMILINISIMACGRHALARLLPAGQDTRRSYFVKHVRRFIMLPLIYLAGILISLYDPHLSYTLYVLVIALSVLQATARG